MFDLCDYVNDLSFSHSLYDLYDSLYNPSLNGLIKCLVTDRNMLHE